MAPTKRPSKEPVQKDEDKRKEESLSIYGVVQENYYKANNLHDKILKLQAKISDTEFDDGKNESVYGMLNFAQHTNMTLVEIGNSIDTISLKVFGKKVDDL